MTRKEYISMAKRINQRMVEAEKRAEKISEYADVQKALAARGRKRLPERIAKMSDAALAPFMQIAAQYEPVKSFHVVKRRGRKPAPVDPMKKLMEGDKKEYTQLKAQMNRKIRNVLKVGGAGSSYVVQSMYEELAPYLSGTKSFDEKGLLPGAKDLKPEDLAEVNTIIKMYAADPHMQMMAMTDKEREQFEAMSKEERDVLEDIIGETDVYESVKEDAKSGKRKGKKKKRVTGDPWAWSAEERKQKLRGYYTEILQGTLRTYAERRGKLSMLDLTDDEWFEVAFQVAAWLQKSRTKAGAIPESETIIDNVVNIVRSRRERSGDTPEEAKQRRSEASAGMQAFEKALATWGSKGTENFRDFNAYLASLKNI